MPEPKPKRTGTDDRKRERQYENMFPRLLNAVTGMATSTGSLRERLAMAVIDVCVFSEDSIPAVVVPEYRQFRELVSSPTVHPAYLLHLHPVKSTPAFYLTPAKARRAAELLASMFETVAYGQGWSEEDLRDVETEDAARRARESSSKPKQKRPRPAR